MNTLTRGIALSALATLMVGTQACGGSSESKGPLDNVQAIIFIQRQARMDGLGNIFPTTRTSRAPS